MKSYETKNDICAIIVVYNGFDCLRKTVETIINQVGKVVLVDNNSDEDTLNLIKDLVLEYTLIHVIYNKSNLGIAAAFNQGVNYAKENGFEFVLTLDQDSISAPTMVEKMLNVYEKLGNDPMVSLCPRVIYDYNDNAVANRGRPENYRSRLVSISSGHLLNLALLDSVGDFNEDLFIDSVDFDYCLRIRLAGGRIIECCNAVLYQQLGYNQVFSLLGCKNRISLHNPTRYYYMLRNHVYITKTYYKKFPQFCTKKQIGMISEIVKAYLFHSERIVTMRFIDLGIKDGINNHFGKLNKEV